ncbi:MAG: RNA methyltransferase, partial [Clostridia bacterium]|nr:RNA methyltransferase [Clostridia bacterium]
MVVTSKENASVVAAVKLKDKKGRREQGKFLIEGQKLVYDAKKYGIRFDKIFVTEQYADKFAGFGEVVVVAEKVMAHISDTKTNQGVVAVAFLPQEKVYDGKKALLLDRIQDPGNIGSVLRTACATGYTNVFLIDCADVFSPKSIRGGMSGQFMLNFFEVSEEDFLAKYGDRYIVCADMNGQNVFDFDCPDDHIIILGNEGQGVSANLSKAAKSTVMIPMQNNLESL